MILDASKNYKKMGLLKFILCYYSLDIVKYN